MVELETKIDVRHLCAAVDIVAHRCIMQELKQNPVEDHMKDEIRQQTLSAIKSAELAVLDDQSDRIQDIIASAVRELSSLHAKIMIDGARSTHDAKRFKRTQRNNTSGSKGVTFNKSAGKWQAKIGVGAGRSKHIGYFESMDQAVVARAKAEAEMWARRN
jgi:hypothetical protein